jgi:hypothetical protein
MRTSKKAQKDFNSFLFLPDFNLIQKFFVIRNKKNVKLSCRIYIYKQLQCHM